MSASTDRCAHGVRFPHECKDCLYEECECAMSSRGSAAGSCGACGRWVSASTKTDVAPGYHAHLDACPRCSSRPFDLCAEGCRAAQAGGDMMGLSLAPDEARAYERALAAFDDAAHETLLATRQDAAAQTLAQALVYAATDAERAVVRDILDAIEADGLRSAYRVAGVSDGAVWMMRSGDAKRPGAAEMRDDVVRAIERAGLRVTVRGCWDFEVRR